MPDDPHPLLGPARSPEWAKLARLAGDRASILLQSLRQAVGKITGLQEELLSGSPEAGWVIRYGIGREDLFSLHVRPGALEGTLTLQSTLRDALVHSHLIKPGEAPDGPSKDGAVSLHAPLKSQQDVRSFVRLVVKKSRLMKHAH